MIYFILFILIISIIAFRTHLRNKRIKLVCEMDALYDKMTLYIAKNHIKPDKKLLQWMKGHKNIIVNYEFADIQIYLIYFFSVKPDTLKQRSNDCKAYEKSLPQDLVDLSNQISVRVLKLVRLSKWKPDFVWFLIVSLAFGLYKKGIYGIRQFIASLKTCINDSNNIYMLDKDILIAA